MHSYEKLGRKLKVECRLEDACVLTTFKGGGKAFTFYPDSEEKLIKLFQALVEAGASPFMIGGGSNVIIADGVAMTPLIATKRLDAIGECEGRIYAQCGTPVAKLLAYCRKRGKGGLEFLSGVPASIGGALKMNAGAFGLSIGDFANKIYTCIEKSAYEQLSICDNRAEICLNLDVETLIAKISSQTFGYRRGAQGILLSAEFDFDDKEPSESIRESQRFLALRKCKQPKAPSCGSVFKNPGVAAGKLIEGCGLKGYCVNGAQISLIHANFIVNNGSATARDFMQIARTARDRVYEKYDIELENEFVYVQ